VLIDAIILAGGRSSRLGSRPKSEFTIDGMTLLESTVNAARVARRTVIVGPPSGRLDAAEILRTREDPPYSGPSAAIAAGVRTLTHASTTPSEFTLVLACDMPHVDLAVPSLLGAMSEHPSSDGAIAIDAEGRRQPLAALYGTDRLAAILLARLASDTLESLPVSTLIRDLALIPVDVPAGATSDVDTWDDATRLGAIAPEVESSPLNDFAPTISADREKMHHE
jgi:molybdopterin-guanine dinucleotide biosynthesis protein A